MARKEESLFGLSPIATKHESSSHTQLTSYQPGQQITGLEQKVIEEMRLQRLIIEAETVITVFGMSKIAELHTHGSATFEQTVAEIFAVKEQTRSKEAQAYIDEFSTRQLSLYGKETLGALDVGATIIAFEIHRSLYPEPDPPQPKSIWQRLAGK